MIKSYHSNITKIYENIRQKNEQTLNLRKEEIRKTVPEILDIESEIGKLCIKLSINILNNVKYKDKYLKELKEKIKNLRKKRLNLCWPIIIL